MKKQLNLILIAFCVPFLLTAQPSTNDLIISEYVEGSSYNKYLEVYNGTGQSVDLSDYEVHVFSNGNVEPNYGISLEGTLNHGEVFVIANGSAELYSTPDISTGSLNFNGDDAVALYKISLDDYIDVFGCIGVDPGSAWISGTLTTLDVTLRRKTNVTSGASRSDNETDFNTLGTEWIASDMDDVSGLGVHGTATFSILAETADEVILFPNPARDFISIRSDKKVEEVRIFDMTGQPARVSRHFDGRINVSALRSGIYIAKIRLTGNEFRILKFTKE
ncbi:MAG: trimeric autotransporter adhesin [Anaerophaga sp.]|nr:trimeric autotransporter adhesin [Anaerophaga sp.]